MVYQLTDGKDIGGMKTTMRYASLGNASIYKWIFDFKRDNLVFIANNVQKIISSVQPDLKQLQVELCGKY